MKAGHILIGLVAGLAAGAIVGILVAPDKGSKTRKKIKDKGEDYLDELKDNYDKLAKSLTKKSKELEDLEEAISN